MKNKLFFSVGMILVLLFGGYRFRYIPGLAAGWRYEVYAEHLRDVSSLALWPGHGLLVTLEGHSNDGQLSLLNLQGHQETLLDGLQKPDGLVPYREGWLLTQEALGKPLLFFDGQRSRSLYDLDYAEGLAVDHQQGIVVAQDMDAGYVSRFDPRDGTVHQIMSALQKPEGVCVAPNDDLYVAESATGAIYKYAHGQQALLTIVVGASYLFCDADNSLWITSDKTYTGQLVHYVNGDIVVIASHLWSPQSILIEGNTILLAEQGRNRILKLTHL